MDRVHSAKHSQFPDDEKFMKLWVKVSLGLINTLNCLNSVAGLKYINYWTNISQTSPHYTVLLTSLWWFYFCFIFCLCFCFCFIFVCFILIFVCFCFIFVFIFVFLFVLFLSLFLFYVCLSFCFIFVFLVVLFLSFFLFYFCICFSFCFIFIFVFVFGSWNISLRIRTHLKEHAQTIPKHRPSTHACFRRV